METTDLAFGQGWSNAERASENVTREILAAAAPAILPDAFVIEAGDPEALAAEVVAGNEGRAIDWDEARARLDGRDPQVAAVILLLRAPR